MAKSKQPISTQQPAKKVAADVVAPGNTPNLTKTGAELTAMLGEIVAVLLRDARFRHMTLHELEAFVVPAILTNQVMLMRGLVRPQEGSDAPKEEGLHVPVGLAIWASVSDDVHEKLTRQAKDRAGFRLAPGEWTGGGHLWLLALVGPEQTMPALRDKVIESVFENKLHSEHTLARVRTTKPASVETEQDLGETKH